MIKPLLRLAALAALSSSALAEPSESRRFEFDYSCRVTEIPLGAESVDLWVPLPWNTPHDRPPHQQVQVMNGSIPPEAEIGTDGKFGNKMIHQRFRAPFPEKIGFDLRLDITRQEAWSDDAKKGRKSGAAEPLTAAAKYLGPTAKIALDGKVGAVATGLGLPSGDPLGAARAIYDYVVSTMKFDKTGDGWGRGDAAWACESKRGNCADFHSVFMGLARSQNIPSDFEIGFSIPEDLADGEVAGYHCWSWFYAPGAGWTPVDASEASRRPDKKDYFFGALPADRVTFSHGRDITLDPPQQGPALNFFIYPYVEIDGKPHEGVQRRFAFKDLQ